MPTFTPIAKTAEIADQSAKCFEVGGRRIAVFNAGGRFYALDDRCPHEDGPLSEGLLEGDEVVCPWHGSRFNLQTGQVTLDPAEANVASYAVRVVGDSIEVEI